MGFLGGSDGKESAMWETQVWSLDQDDPLEKGMATYSCILKDGGAWQATVHGVSKSWTRLDTTDVTNTHTYIVPMIFFFYDRMLAMERSLETM